MMRKVKARALVPLLGTGLFVAAAILAPVLATERPWISDAEGRAVVGAPIPFSPEAIDLTQRLRAPDRTHWLGTDDLGRDVLARLVHGARVSVFSGLLAAALALALGAFLGTAAALGGGLADRTVLFGIEVVQAFPALVLVAAAAAVLPASFSIAALLIAATSWPDAARVVRAEARRVRTLPFVESARAAGSSRVRLLFAHVLPHALVPALSMAPYILGAAVLTEASLSFLGMGTPPPTPSWGRALADATGRLEEAPWCAVPPGVAILLLVLSARRLGNFLDRPTSTIYEQ
jgi:peptide/nickel transport system permease protein